MSLTDWNLSGNQLDSIVTKGQQLSFVKTDGKYGITVLWKRIIGFIFQVSFVPCMLWCNKLFKSAPRNLVDLILARLNLTMVWSFIISMKLNVWGLDSSRAFGQSTAHITITALIHCKLDYCTIVCAKSTHISSKSINRLQLTKSYFCNVF